MSEGFATSFQGSVTDKPVVGHTGLTDRCDLTLKWRSDDTQFVQFRGTLQGQVEPVFV